MLGKNGLHIHNQQEKNYQNDELFVSGYKKVFKMQAIVINTLEVAYLLNTSQRMSSIVFKNSSRHPPGGLYIFPII